jgi:hypothetical protein
MAIAVYIVVTRGVRIAGPELLSAALVFPLSFLDARFIVGDSCFRGIRRVIGELWRDP